VEVDEDGNVQVHRVVCAVDCGMVVNPSAVEAQMEGGIVFGLTAALKDAITVKNGRVEQRSLKDFRMLRMDEMPAIEVYIVPSDRQPTGIGEMGVPPTAPALLNPIYAATGTRVRSLPVRL
jgi:isoquinoline 1-oxidoreductase beta subunit